ncbi:DUF3310 domain-containing protein [Akkermansiaceae bacterium]|nr:DUF3310 domain-containing protein [Akkermansiaceae bacterium]
MYSLTETKITEDINMNVSQTMIDEANNQECASYLINRDYQFKEENMMYACAEKAGLEIMSFYEVYGNPPHHRYECLDLVGQQMDGDMPRITLENIYAIQEEKDIDVSKGRLAEAARIGLDRLARSEPMVPPRSVASATKEVDDISQAVSGSHYNDVVPGYQYMEMMQHMLEGKEGVEAHLLGQVYKYLMRAGKKDDVEQEYRKARWYLNCLVKYQQTGEVDPNNND